MDSATSSPTASRNSNGPTGYPQPSFIAASMSSTVEYPDSSIRTASFRYGKSRLFTTNPARSPQTTGVLPAAASTAVAVATASGEAGYSQYALVDADLTAKVPDSVDLHIAAALPLQGMTAHYLVHSSYMVHEGDVILTYAGAGGVGLILTQLLKLKGATVITTASTQEKKDLAKAAGADYVVDYDQVADTVEKVTGGKGVNAVYDGIGKDTFETSLAALRRRGTLVLFGGASGQVPPFDLQRLNAGGSLTVTRPKLADFLTSQQEMHWRFGDMVGWVATGKIDVRIGAQYPLAEAGAAHAALESRATTGKVILVP